MVRDYLSEIITKKENWNLEVILSSFKEFLSKKKKIIIYGCGVSLEESVNYLLKNKINLNKDTILNIAADGASRLLKEKKIDIGAIFSDLDGISKKEFSYPDYMIVHAHGDNLEKIRYFESEILKCKNIIFTCQVEPTKYILNPGGFTDGDRILFFLRALLEPAQKLYLIGMDFENQVGKYSKLDYQKNHQANDIKQKKLKYASELIDWLRDHITNQLSYVNSKKPSKRYDNIELEAFYKMLL